MFSVLGSLIKPTFQPHPTSIPPKELYGPNGQRALDDFLNNAMGPDPAFSPLGDLTNPIHPIFSECRFLQGIKGLQCVQEIFQHLGRLGMVNIVFGHPRLDGPDDNIDILGQMCFHDQHYIAAHQSYFKNCPAWVINSESTDTIKVVANDGSTTLKRVCKGVAMICFPQKELRYFEHGMSSYPARYQLNDLLFWTHTLLHEVMHAFYRFVCPEASGGPNPRYVFESELHELGLMYNLWLNGGRMPNRHYARIDKEKLMKPYKVGEASNCRTVFIECLEWQVYASDSTQLEVKGVSEHVILSTDVVHAWFLEKTWGRIRNEGHGFLLKESERTSLDWWELHSQSGYYGIQLRWDHKVYKRVFCGDVRVDQPILQTFGKGWEELRVVEAQDSDSTEG